MKTIAVRLKGRAYPIILGGPLSALGAQIRKSVLHKGVSPSKALVVSHPFLKKTYGQALESGIRKAGIKATWAMLKPGESGKNLKAVEGLYRACVKAGMDRSSCVIALGGGVAGDIAGFAAATYLRGIAVVQVPTTLLAMVDSAIGGKTGVDLPEAKNFVGAFHQPRTVWADLSVLKTLPEAEFVNGMGEIIKYGVIKDASLFNLLEKESPWSAHSPKLAEVVARCAEIKAEVVSKDEHETKGLREILNFGHTLGHAIETVTKYKSYKHGEAVALGMCAAGWMSVKLGLWKRAELDRMQDLIADAGLPVRLKLKLSPQQILKALFRDKKNLSGNIRFVLPVKIGKVIVRKVPPRLALQALEYVKS